MSDPSHIRGWRRIDPGLTTSGQPKESELAEIAALGVTRVINLGLHTHADALADEAASVASLGMIYRHIPVAFDDPTEEDYRQFADELRESEGQTLHIHCIANMRVTAFLYRFAKENQGVDVGDVRRAMDSIWQPGGRWAALIGDTARSDEPHGPPVGTLPPHG